MGPIPRRVLPGLLAVLASVFALGAQADDRSAGLRGPLEPVLPGEFERIGGQIAGLLSGRVYVAATGKNDDPARGQDVVRFTGPLLSTDLCDRFKFRAAPYHVRIEGGILYFMAVLRSETEGELVFSGRIDGERLLAEASWRRPRWYGDVYLRLWFYGARADPAANHAAYLD